MEKLDKVSNSITWYDVSHWLLGFIALCSYGIWRFGNWFVADRVAEVYRKIEVKIDNKVNLSEKRLGNKIDKGDAEIMSHLIKYKSEKHDLANEHAGLVGTTQICSEALDKATLLIEKYEKERNK